MNTSPEQAHTPHSPVPDRVVTQRDVAQRCGLHQTTVSLALRRDPRIAEETVERVQAVAAEIGYDPTLNTTARRLAQRRFGHQALNHVIALSVHPQFIHFHYNAAIFSGVVDVLIPEGYAVTISHFPGSGFTADEITVPTIFSRGDVDALIIDYPPTPLQPLAERLRQAPGFAQRPIVGMIYQHADISSVTTDDRHGAYQSTRYLLETGHRHLVQLCTTTDVNMAGLQALRWEGVRQALIEYGLDPARHLHFCVIPVFWENPLWLPATDETSSYTETKGGEVLVGLVRAHPEITAILGMNDACAQQAWRVLSMAGFAVPEEISIIGFDDVDPKFDDSGRNVLASVRLPLVEMGRTAAALAIEHVTGQLTEKRDVLLPVQFIPRASAAPAHPRKR